MYLPPLYGPDKLEELVLPSLDHGELEEDCQPLHEIVTDRSGREHFEKECYPYFVSGFYCDDEIRTIDEFEAAAILDKWKSNREGYSDEKIDEFGIRYIEPLEDEAHTTILGPICESDNQRRFPTDILKTDSDCNANAPTGSEYIEPTGLASVQRDLSGDLHKLDSDVGEPEACGLEPATDSMCLRQPEPRKEDRKTIIINFLPPDITNETLRELCSPFGIVERATVASDKYTQYPLGYGFVKFREEIDATAAVVGLNFKKIGQKNLKVTLARNSSTEIKDTNLFVKNLRWDVTEEFVRNLFSPYGEIIHINLPKYSDGGPKGFAFVRYATRDQAARAIEALDNFNVVGYQRPIEVALAKNHGKEKAEGVGGSHYCDYSFVFE